MMKIDGLDGLEHLMDGDENVFNGFSLPPESEESKILIEKGRQDYEKVDQFNKPGSVNSGQDSSDTNDSAENLNMISSKVNSNNSNYYFSKFLKTHNPYENIFYKKSSQITEDEIFKSKRFANYETKDTNLKILLNNRINDWYKDIYGNNSIAYDATGRMKTPKAKKSFAENLIPLTTKDGIQIGKAFYDISDILGNETNSLSVKSLQESINHFLDSNHLKEDGIIGKKTTSALKKVLTTYGYSPLYKYLFK